MKRSPTGQRLTRNSTGDVLEILLDRKPWTRADLARASALSRATIVARLDVLRDAGLIRDVGQSPSEIGRPTTRIALNDHVRTVAAVELSHSSCQITLANLGAQPIDQTTIALSAEDDHVAILRTITAAMRTLLDGMSDDQGPLGSVTLGVPMSATGNAAGLLHGSESRGWLGFPVREWLENELSVTVHIENDVNLIALGERMESFPDADDLLLVHVADGIGLGMIANGRLVRGSGGLAGEIAHVPTPRPHFTPCMCGNVGCLASVATLPAIIRALNSEDCDASSVDDLIALVSRGDALTARVLRDAGRHVGEVLVYPLSTANPAVLVLSGSLAFAGDHLIAGIREALYRAAPAPLVDNLQITRSSVPTGAGTRGALHLSAEHILTDGSLFALLEDSNL